MWGSLFSGGKDPLKDLGYEILADSQQVSTANARSIWTILNGKKKVSYLRKNRTKIFIAFIFHF